MDYNPFVELCHTSSTPLVWYIRIFTHICFTLIGMYLTVQGTEWETFRTALASGLERFHDGDDVMDVLGEILPE